jgi:hypothetical protein
MLARISLAVVALLAAAWMVVLTRDTHLFDQATAPPPGGVGALPAALRSPGGLARRADQLDASRLLTPDTAAELQTAVFLEVRGAPEDLVQAFRIAAAVARREPQNLDAWVDILGIARARHDNLGAGVALAHVRRLDPLLAPRS